MHTFGSLFAGIGGMDLGLERAGWGCKWQVEIDEWCRRVLTKHWPDVPKYGDVKEINELPPVDLICGGFPCQPVSYAGRRKGRDDDRWLWPEFERIIRLVRPRFVIVENVPGLLTHGMGDVLGGLASSGFDAEWDLLPAAAVGAPHLRYRVFIVAHRQADAPRPDANGLGSHREEVNELGGTELRDEQERQSRSVGADVADTSSDQGRVGNGNGQADVLDPTGEGLPLGDARSVYRSPAFQRSERSDWWASEPEVGRVANGVPARVDRLRGLGNAVVPQVAEWIGRRLMEVAA